MKNIYVGYNVLGGGFNNKGVFKFSTQEEAQQFVSEAPITRAWETMTEALFEELFGEEEK